MRGFRIVAASAGAALGVACLTVPADAATGGSLTVRTIDRHGRTVRTSVDLVNPSTEAEKQFSSGKSKSLRKGRYALGVVISTPDDGMLGSQTLAARTVTIGSKHVDVTLDARKGKRFSVSPRGATLGSLSKAAVCAGRSILGQLDSDGRAMYLVPNTDRALDFGYRASWVTGENGPFYWVSGSARGVPGGLVRDQAHLHFATIRAKVTTKRSKRYASTLLMGTRDCPGGTDGWSYFSAPRTVTAYVTTGHWSGYVWNSRGVSNDVDGRFVAGHTYHVTFKA
ncbi:hypothetical protein [Actinomadura rupiterrae]|uniref:hypothetical protein n=1 Tax=Actinomadura rupiterrae TaxID=559627 RepID=UPI0020A4F41D|nr:hypothetical protein [Actinomadura rupiterrae]MCP2336805.1 hypothetical protein [Actinomadura rupiterrae]